MRNLKNQIKRSGGQLNLRTIVHSQVLRILENIRIVEAEKVSMGS